jgi:hypothetical protein
MRENTPLLAFTTVGLSVCLFLIATTGGRLFLVPEVLGAAFDSQAKNLMHGNPDVDTSAIRHEAYIVDGRTRMYFGVFPCLLRPLLNLIYPSGYGRWSRLCGFLAALLALLAFSMLVRDCLSASALTPHQRAWVGSFCLLGFVFATPFLFLLGNLSIYNEAILWAFATSITAIFFLDRSLGESGPRRTWYLCGFSTFAGAALLSRVTYGLPFLFVLPLLVHGLPREARRKNLLAVLLPLGLALFVHFALSYWRFGVFSGVDYRYYINPTHREFARSQGIFHPRRILTSFIEYFGLRFPTFETKAPFVRGDLHWDSYKNLYSNPYSEVYITLPWCSGWLLIAAMLGVGALSRNRREEPTRGALALGLLAQGAPILCYFALAQRYSTDFYPFLLFAMAAFLRFGETALVRSRHALAVLVIVSCFFNTTSTVSWLVDSDQNVLPQTRVALQKMLGRNPPEALP